MEKALDSGADAVVVDLEDGVAIANRAMARTALGRFGAAFAARTTPPLFGVRLGGTDEQYREEVRLAVEAGASFLRLPKVESGADVARVASWIDDVAQPRKPRGRVLLQPMVESAAGVLAAAEIATAPRVLGLALGAADLAADLGLPVGLALALDSIKVQLALVSAAAKLAPPVDSVSLDLNDTDALRSSTDRSRSLGMFGRSAVHPRQVAIINEVFTPARRDVEAAEKVIAASRAADGGATSSDGRLVDAPVVLQALRVLALRDRFGETSDG